MLTKEQQIDVNNYNFITKRLPEDIVRYIHEYADPDTTEIVTVTQEIQKKYPSFRIWLDNQAFKSIIEYRKLIPIIYEKNNKYIITQDEKHKIENLYYNINKFIDHKIDYVEREHLIVAFVLCGFELFEIEHKRTELIIYRIRAKVNKRILDKIKKKLLLYDENKRVILDKNKNNRYKEWIQNFKKEEILTKKDKKQNEKNIKNIEKLELKLKIDNEKLQEEEYNYRNYLFI
jgi:hypothetical protein